MTKIVEDRAALAELYLKSTKPVADKDFEGQFNVQHLAKQDRITALQMFRKHKQAFSQHACNLGKASKITMNILVTTEEPHIQKYDMKGSASCQGFNCFALSYVLNPDGTSDLSK